MAATTITRTAMTDGSSGTLIDNAWKSSLYDQIDGLFTSAFTFGDTVSAEGLGTHTFSAGGSGGNILLLRNSTGGTGNFAAVHLGTDTDADAVRLEAYTSTHTETGAIKQDGAALRSIQDGGVSIAAEHASGTVRQYAGGTAKSSTFDGNTHVVAGALAGTYGLNGIIQGSIDTGTDGTPANTTETTLKSFSLPAGTLATDNQAIRIRAWGTTAANGNTKTIRLKFGSTTLVAPTSAMNDGKWLIEGVVFRTGATSQDAVAGVIASTAASGALGSTANVTTPAETLSGAVTVALTGQNGTASANDIVCEGFYVELLPGA